MSGFRATASIKTFGLAAFGYLLVLGAGVTAGRMIDGEGFAGLGLIAFTTVVFAPLGAVIGAYVGMSRFGHPRSQRLDWRVTLAIATVVIFAMAIVEGPFQIMVALIGLVLAMTLRSGLEFRPVVTTRPRPIRKVPLP